MSTQPVLTEEFCAAIGRVVANFALLESAVGVAVAGLTYARTPNSDDRWPPEDTGSDDERIVGEILTNGSSFRRNLEMFACLQRLRNPNHDPEAFETLLKTLFGVEESRNKVVHSLWSGGEGGAANRYKTTSRIKGHKTYREDVTLAGLTEVAEQIAEACSQIMPYMFGGKPHSAATVTQGRF